MLLILTQTHRLFWDLWTVDCVIYYVCLKCCFSVLAWDGNSGLQLETLQGTSCCRGQLCGLWCCNMLAIVSVYVCVHFFNSFFRLSVAQLQNCAGQCLCAWRTVGSDTVNTISQRVQSLRWFFTRQSCEGEQVWSPVNAFRLTALLQNEFSRNCLKRPKRKRHSLLSLFTVS